MSIEIDLLRSFIAVAETRSFTKAAERCFIVQSAISAQIQKLEALTGQRLLDRGRGRDVSLTLAGDRFLSYAYQIIRLSNDAVQAIQPTEAKSTLRVGTTETYALTILPDLFAHFASHFPNVYLEMTCDRSRHLLAQLKKDELDVVLATDSGEGPQRDIIHTQPIVWTCGSKFRLHPSDTVPLAFLPTGCLFRKKSLEALLKAGRAHKVIMTSPSPIGVRSLLMSNLAISALPLSSVTPPLVLVDDKAGLPEIGQMTLAIYHNTNKERADVATFVQLLKNSFNI